MTENPTQAPPDPQEPEADTPLVADAPDDIDAELATGWSVYDRTLGRYVGGVHPEKPTATEARKLVTKGHQHKVVRV